MSTVELTCPKCGGKMQKGDFIVPVHHASTQSMSPFMSGGYMGGGIPTLPDESEEKPYWEEKTGEKKGTLFKREETKRMSISGYRCNLCGYIELYAKG